MEARSDEAGVNGDAAEEVEAKKVDEEVEEVETRRTSSRRGGGLKRRAPVDETMPDPALEGSGDVEADIEASVVEGEAAPPKKRVYHGDSMDSPNHRSTPTGKKSEVTGTSMLPHFWKPSTAPDANFGYPSYEHQTDTLTYDSQTPTKPLTFHEGWPHGHQNVESEFSQVHYSFPAPQPRYDEIQFRSGLPRSVLKQIQQKEASMREAQATAGTSSPSHIESAEPTLVTGSDGAPMMFWPDPSQVEASTQVVHYNGAAQAQAAQQEAVFVNVFPGAIPTNVVPATTQFSFVFMESPYSSAKKVEKPAPTEEAGTNANVEAATTPAARGRRKSDIWSHYEQENGKYICQLCKAAGVTSTATPMGVFSLTTTTRTLKKHFGTHHARVGADGQPLDSFDNINHADMNQLEHHDADGIQAVTEELEEEEGQGQEGQEEHEEAPEQEHADGTHEIEINEEGQVEHNHEEEQVEGQEFEEEEEANGEQVDENETHHQLEEPLEEAEPEGHE